VLGQYGSSNAYIVCIYVAYACIIHTYVYIQLNVYEIKLFYFLNVSVRKTDLPDLLYQLTVFTEASPILLRLINIDSFS